MPGQNDQSDRADQDGTTETGHRPAVTVTEPDLAVLARVAGLRIAEHRLPGLARDLTTTLGLAASLDEIVPATVVPVVRPFDPSWPAEGDSTR